jgi:hypothetical protein
MRTTSMTQAEIPRLPAPEEEIHLEWTDRSGTVARHRDFLSGFERWFFVLAAVGVVAPSLLLIGEACKCVAGIVLDFCTG